MYLMINAKCTLIVYVKLGYIIDINLRKNPNLESIYPTKILISIAKYILKFIYNNAALFCFIQV